MAQKRRKRKKKHSWLIIACVLIITLIGAYQLISKKTALTISTSFHGIRPLSETYKSHGIDISHHQGKIDWDLFYKKSDSIISFVYCKATEGVDFVDPKWATNQIQLEKREIPHGCYHFFQPGEPAKEQAIHYLTHYKYNQNDLPPALDSEIQVENYSALIQSMKEWLIIIEDSTGKRPIIYTSYHLYRTQFKDAFNGYKFWIANYNTNPPKLDDTEIIHWQYSDKGRIPGIRGDVDLNVSKIQF